MSDNLISLKEHFEKVLKVHLDSLDKLHNSEERALSVAREELNHWKAAHNEWQKQMRDAQSLYITRAEHKETGKKIDQLERLIYIGVGISMSVSVGIEIVLSLVKGAK